MVISAPVNAAISFTWTSFSTCYLSVLMFLFGLPHQVCFPLKFELILPFLIELIWAFLLVLTSQLHSALVPVLAYSLMFHNCVYFA